jgi:tRNA A37 threonylcarbamoyladenosine biosynthesis protein TsaE
MGMMLFGEGVWGPAAKETLPFSHASRPPSPPFPCPFPLPIGSLHHMDLYRLPASDDGSILSGAEERDILVIEWPERLGPKSTPLARLDVHLALGPAPVTAVEEEEGEDVERQVTFAPHGARFEELVERLQKKLREESLLREGPLRRGE